MLKNKSNKRQICVLGSTGSIGVNTLDVIRLHRDKFNVVSLSANASVDKIFAQCLEFQPKTVVMVSVSHAEQLASRLAGENLEFIEVKSGVDALVELARSNQTDTVMAAIVGAAGLMPTLAAVQAGKRVLLANKEALVTSGAIFIEAVKQSGAELLPIDSEHNAIYQCLLGEKDTSAVSTILITASGGPFRRLSMQDLETVSLQDALQHPTWQMGSKITIDSATLMNKCLELIEACYLFNLPESRIEVATHPQSIIHSMVTYQDGSTIAQLSNPSMEVPIANALGMGDRLPIKFTALDFSAMSLTFEPIPAGRETIFEMAREVCRQKGSLGAIFNAANEKAVQAFLDNEITFINIYEVVERTFNHFSCSKLTTIEDVFDYDRQARIQAEKVIKSLN